MTTRSVNTLDEFNEVANEYVYLDTLVRHALRMARNAESEDGSDKEMAKCADTELTMLFDALHDFVRVNASKLDKGQAMSLIMRLTAFQKNELARTLDIQYTF